MFAGGVPLRGTAPLLLEAGELITAQEAERRVLVLENPGFHGDPESRTASTQDCNW